MKLSDAEIKDIENAGGAQAHWSQAFDAGKKQAETYVLQTCEAFEKGTANGIGVVRNYLARWLLSERNNDVPLNANEIIACLTSYNPRS